MSADIDSPSDRDRWFRENGFRILRLWNNDIFTNEEGVMAAVLLALEAIERASSPLDRTTLPDPSPTRGEGLLESEIG